MPSIKEIYNSIGEVELNAESINLNVDGLEALASTQQADIALIKADVDDIRADLANGVTINQPVAVTDNAGSLTVDGSVSVSNFPATQPVSGTVTANAGTGSFTVAQSTAASLKAQSQILNSAGAVVSPAEVGTAGSPSIDVLSVQGVTSGTPIFVAPRNNAATVVTGTTANTSSNQVLASNTSRRYLLIQNLSDTDMNINFGAAASASTLLLAKNGSGIVFESGYVPTDAINLICSASSKAYYILHA
jgi:hypothetical protein